MIFRSSAGICAVAVTHSKTRNNKKLYVSLQDMGKRTTVVAVAALALLLAGIAILLLGLMLFFAVIVYVTSKFPGLPRPVAEAPFVLFWMALWDAAEFLFLDGRDLQEDKLEAAQLASMKVTFYEKFEDGPAEPEVVQW